MAKGDSPPYRMVMKNGTMIPATQHDLEYLSSYRNGSEVSVIITQEVASWRRRKYWAILALVIKTCGLPKKAGSTTDSLHDAICREAGYVDSYSSDGTTLTIRRQKTSKFDDQKFEAFYRDAMEVLQEWTGLDAETLSKESADVGRDETEQPEQSPPDDTGSGSSGDETPPAKNSAAADQSASGGPEEGGSDTGATANEPSSDPRDPKVILNLKAEAVAKFLELATNKDLPDPRDRREVLVKAKEAWKRELPHHHDFLKACVSTADAVIKGQMPADKARQYLEGLVR